MHIRIGFRSYTIPILSIKFLPPTILFVCICILDNSIIIPVLLFTPGLILSCLLFFTTYYPENDWLVFDNGFNKPLTNVVFPTGIKKIRFGLKFNQEIHNLPNSLTHLTFGYWFNQDVSNLPNSLTHLTFGWHFDREIRNLPNSLTHLTFGCYFNKDVSNLPNSLTHLTFDHWFNQEIRNLPNSLTYLEFGWNFNQDVHNLPNSLTHLTFGWCFNQEIHNLPKSITYLIFNKWSDHKFNHNLNPYLYHLIKICVINHKHKSLMLNRCRVNQHNSAIRNDKLIDLLLKK